MPRILPRALLCLALILLPPTVLAEAFWETDWKAAKRRAATEQRPLLVDFAAPWCAPCRTMDEQFWPLAEVGEATARFVRVRLDFDHPNEASRRFWVTAIPAVLVLDPWGNLLGRQVGFGNSEVVLSMIRAVPDDFAEIAAASAAAADEKSSAEALLALGRHYLEAGLPAGSNTFLEPAVESRELRKAPRLRADTLVAIGLNHLQLGAPERARKALEKAFEIDGGPQRVDEGLFGLVLAHCGLNERARAAKSLAALETRYPASGATAAAKRAFEGNCGE